MAVDHARRGIGPSAIISPSPAMLASYGRAVMDAQRRAFLAAQLCASVESQVAMVRRTRIVGGAPTVSQRNDLLGSVCRLLVLEGFTPEEIAEMARSEMVGDGEPA